MRFVHFTHLWYISVPHHASYSLNVLHKLLVWFCALCQLDSRHKVYISVLASCSRCIAINLHSFIVVVAFSLLLPVLSDGIET